MQDLYAETVSAINFQNGIVRMLLVDQDPALLMKPGAKREEIEPRLKQQIVMPLPGFLYMVSVIKGLIEDPKMQEIIQKYQDLGLLPPVQSAPGKNKEDDVTAA